MSGLVQDARVKSVKCVYRNYRIMRECPQFLFSSCDGKIVPFFFAGHKSLRSFYAVTSDRLTMFEEDLDESVRLSNDYFFFPLSQYHETARDFISVT